MKEAILIDYIKLFAISIGTIYLDFKILNREEEFRKHIIKLLLYIIIVETICIIIKNVSNYAASVISLDILLSLFILKITKNKIGYSILINTISLSFNNVTCMVAIVIFYIIFTFLDMKNEIINMIIIASIYFVLLFFISRIKKIKHGIAFLIKNKDNEYFEVLILNLSATISLCFILINNLNLESIRALFVYMVIFSEIMFITIQKSLQLYYKQRMLVKDLEETKEELENKKKEIAKLEKEIIGFSKISHSIVHKQKSLEHKLEELSMNNEIADETNLKERIKNLNKNIKKKQVIVLDKTGIVEIDDMLNYMQAECSKNKIDFQLQLNGNIHTMVNNYINKEKLEILLADHIKNAIIAIGYSKNVNKSILVRLGKLDGIYGLYIYDSGIEFEIETFLNLGKKPCTTHKDSGGTGMGFLNTFDTLKECKASFIIEEYGKPVKNNFTKALKFKFDNKQEFKIYSYRHEEIKKKDKENILNVENLKN